MVECFVCHSKMEPFLKKTFHMDTLGECEYVRCETCGMVVSKTHYEMNIDTWQRLNEACHMEYQGTDSNAVDPNWIARLENQSRMLVGLFQQQILLKNCRCLDYGCGDGKLVDIIHEMLPEPCFEKYDEYMGTGKENYLKKEELASAPFDCVVTCSVFEHLIGRKDVDKIFGLLSDDGTFGLHTLVCEEVPQDAEWFYFLPVHCSFYTNRSMQQLFSQYGFKGCAYHVESRMWLFFRDRQRYERLKSCVDLLPGTWQMSDSFVDYWKQTPYRKK